MTSASMYHALYLLPLKHIGIIALLQSSVSSLGLQCATLDCQSGKDSLLVRRSAAYQSACMFSVEDFAVGVKESARFSSVCSLLGEPFSCVLRIACADFGMLKFAAECADVALDSCSFGSRFQCWLTVVDAAALAGCTPWIARKWVKFRDAASSTLSKLALSSSSLHHRRRQRPCQRQQEGGNLSRSSRHHRQVSYARIASRAQHQPHQYH